MIESQIYINDGKLYYLSNEGDRIDKNIFISDLYINKSNGSLIFIKTISVVGQVSAMNWNAKYSDSHFVNILNFMNNQDYLKGLENGRQVEYIRVK